MPVTELCLLRLKEGKEWTSSEVLDGLRKAKTVLERVTGSAFHFLRCEEQPDTCYMHGGWETIDDHWKFVPSEANKELQAAIKDIAIPEWAFHIDIDQAKTPLPAQSKVIALGRWYPKEGKIDELEMLFTSVTPTLAAGVGGEDKITRGRRLDKGFDPSIEGEPKPEYVVMTGWESVQAHQDFAKRFGESETASRIQSLVNGADFFHATVLV
ncbi:uncharacterized protein Z520_11387 [Fonsecaea multimorphosa CBS 102226]|uniref:ABM domain-containing protein n=1 Tax=Fonsecaea multimorphosa CBS 102226 TaxID=1442371 RepID=A0A0D2I6S5_9EURO|nr:uncharacterized protein Z520_11387 [Fonsecaea multimorphosa CBS 102226]KIX92911.1 hypothetical protein Z520_11387 [Fonsecaea multimorphosa CBS 102226]OAL18161.1 hypothetical protein AYO22_10938 [Fonsecaea multimorphosa]